VEFGFSSLKWLCCYEGFKKYNVKVEIDGTRTLILSGQRRFQEIGMMGWTWHKMECALRGVLLRGKHLTV